MTTAAGRRHHWLAAAIVACVLLLLILPGSLPAFSSQADGTPVATPAGTPGTPGATPIASSDATPAASPVTDLGSAVAVVPGGPLPLGAADLPETRVSADVAPGVVYTHITRGGESTADTWVLDVALVADPAEADARRDELAAAGFDARVEEIADRGPDGSASGVLGYLVRVGAFPERGDAVAAQTALTEAGFAGSRLVYTGEDGVGTDGPWQVHVLEIDPEVFSGSVLPVLATDIVPGKETTASVAARTGALAATNAGYFVVGPVDGTTGDLAGVSVIGGTLYSEAVNGRTAFVLPDATGAGGRVGVVNTAQTATAADGASREIDGLNREPGLIRSCGGVGGDATTEEPKHDYTCTDESELIHYTPAYGQITAAGDGFEVSLDGGGVVLEARARRGGQIPVGGAVLAGTGDAAEWLEANAPVGATIGVDLQVLLDNEELPLGTTLNIVNGGPRLVRDGAIDITAAAEGFVWDDDPGFGYRFGIRRNPRTLAGVTADGKILLVVIDGRQPGWSVGASFTESAGIMVALGAADAVNLDGGGSSAMALGSTLVNRPSDATGERPDGDIIVVLP